MTEPTDPAAPSGTAGSGIDSADLDSASTDSVLPDSPDVSESDGPDDVESDPHDLADSTESTEAVESTEAAEAGESTESMDTAESVPAAKGRHRASLGEVTPPTEPAATGAKAFLLRFEMPLLIALAIGIAIVLKSFVIQPFYIPSESMEQTLHGCDGCSGDRILVFKPVYSVRDPHPGDIVVFKAPPDWEEPGGTLTASNPVARGVQWFGQLVGVVPPSEKDLVKRVIAVGGQTVKCCDADGNLQVSESGPNGPWTSLNEPYIYQPQAFVKPGPNGQKAPNDSRSFGPVSVPKGRLWVLGDHRSDSADSRYHCGAGGSGSDCDPVSSTVPVDDVIGKAVVIAWPPSRWRTLGTPKTFKTLALDAVSFPATQPAAAGGFMVLTTGIVVSRVRRRGRAPRHRRP